MKYTIILLLLSIFLSQEVFSQKDLFKTRKSQVGFVSDAPLELIKATSSQLKGALDPGKRNFSFTIPSRSFEGFNSPLQQIHFYENYIEATKYPEAGFKGKIIEQLDFDKDGEYVIRAKGELTIHGVSQERIIRVKVQVKKGILYATADFSILLVEHNITIPRVVYQKIAEEVFIHVSMEMSRK